MSDATTNDSDVNSRSSNRTPPTDGRRLLSNSKQLLLADAAHTAQPADAPAQGRAPAAPKVERRRQIDPTTCERDYSADEIEFMKAMDEYKRKNGRQFPTWSEVLEVVRSLGYRRG